MHNKGQLLAVGGLVGATILSGAALTASRAGAEPLSASTTATVTVASSCSMTGTLDTEHEATIINGHYQADIGQTTLKSFCNDPNGYAVYAIGFSDDTYGNNAMMASIGQEYNIATGTQENGSTSGWAMKVAAVDGPYAPTIANGFDSYHVVPDTYTKVASYPSNTDSSSTDVGSAVTTTYAAYISSFQSAGTYTGKVKYTLVHPSGGAAPVTSIDDLTYMQDFAGLSSEEYADVLNSMTEGQAYTLKDNRDDYEYKIAKLADDRVWLLDNLQLDLTQPEVLSSLTPENTNADAAALLSLRSGNRDAGANYATEGFRNMEGMTVGYYAFSTPSVYVGSKDDVVPDSQYSIGGQGSGKRGVYYSFCAASAGTACYSPDYSSPVSSQFSVCPAGWRLPAGSTFVNMYNMYTDSEDGASIAATRALSASATGDVYPNNNGAIIEKGIGGVVRFYTSDTPGGGGAPAFYRDPGVYGFHASDVGAYYGLPIRCIADQH